MGNDNIWVTIRDLMKIVGTMLATAGVIEHKDAAAIFAQLDVLIPALVALAGIIWGQWVRWRTKAVPIKTAMREDVPVVSAATGQVIPGPQLTEKAS